MTREGSFPANSITRFPILSNEEGIFLVLATSAMIFMHCVSISEYPSLVTPSPSSESALILSNKSKLSWR